jgi:hypothetical protein
MDRARQASGEFDRSSVPAGQLRMLVEGDYVAKTEPIQRSRED